MGILSTKQILKIGFQSLGKNVHISDKASLYRPEKISIGDNTRIDDFVVISAGDGGISLGKNIHIAVYVSLIGKGKIAIGNYVSLSSRISVYSSNDDYSGKFMTNPTVDGRFTNVEHKNVYIGEHVIIGSGSVILPGATLKRGVVIGALSLVKAGIYKGFSIYGGIPATFIKNRSRNILKLEKEFEKFKNNSD